MTDTSEQLRWELYTERARMVIVLAQDEARALRHTHIGTPHLLLGLLLEREGVAAIALRAVDVEVDRVRSETVELVRPGEDVVSGRIPFSQRAVALLERARDVVAQWGHNYLGTEHLLFALTRDPSCDAVRILATLGVHRDAVAEQIVAILERGKPGFRGRLRRAARAWRARVRSVRAR